MSRDFDLLNHLCLCLLTHLLAIKHIRFALFLPLVFCNCEHKNRNKQEKNMKGAILFFNAEPHLRKVAVNMWLKAVRFPESYITVIHGSKQSFAAIGYPAGHFGNPAFEADLSGLAKICAESSKFEKIDLTKDIPVLAEVYRREGQSATQLKSIDDEAKAYVGSINRSLATKGDRLLGESAELIEFLYKTSPKFRGGL
jgi:hypothetical protein